MKEQAIRNEFEGKMTALKKLAGALGILPGNRLLNGIKGCNNSVLIYLFGMIIQRLLMPAAK
jgi:hypothetical protein